jgi:hypothetical protein
MFWVWQSDEWQFMAFPIKRKGKSTFRTKHNYFGILLDEFIVVLTQLRHMHLAEWSGKSTVEDQ